MVFGLFGAWILFGIITLVAADKKGRNGCGWFFIGALLGPFGFILALLLDPVNSPSSQSEGRVNDQPYYPDAVNIKNISPSETSPDSPPPEEDIQFQDFSNSIVYNWPLTPIECEFSLASEETTSTFKRFKFRNIQSKTIKYSEWEVKCFDILSRKIETASPILFKIEKKVNPGTGYQYERDIDLPSETKTVEIILLYVLFEDGQILDVHEEDPVKVEYSPRRIKNLGVGRKSFLEDMQELLHVDSPPRYYHDSVGQEFWVCSFCGVLNKSGAEKCQCCSSDYSMQQDLKEPHLLEMLNRWEETETKLLEQAKKEKEEQERLEREEFEKHRILEAARIKEDRLIAKRKSRNKTIVVVVIIGVLAVSWFTFGQSLYKYNRAKTLLEDGEFYQASIAYGEISGAKDSATRQIEAYRLYLESSVEDYNADPDHSLVDGYDWMYNMGASKEEIFASIEKIQGRLSDDELDDLLVWLDSHDFSEFLPTISIVEEIDGVEKILLEMRQESFSKLISFQQYAELASYRENLVPEEWSYNLRWGEPRHLTSSLDFEFKFLSDAQVFIEWGPRTVGGRNQFGSTLIYDKEVVTDGWRYIEVAPMETIWSGIQWSTLTTKYLNLEGSIGYGKENTDKIIRETLPTDKLLKLSNAANLCNNLEYKGYSDWVLPSKDELDRIYRVYKAGGLPELPPSIYWSSTDKDWFSAWAQDFSDGSQSALHKNSKACVIAIRYFGTSEKMWVREGPQ